MACPCSLTCARFCSYKVTQGKCTVIVGTGKAAWLPYGPYRSTFPPRSQVSANFPPIPHGMHGFGCICGFGHHPPFGMIIVGQMAKDLWVGQATTNTCLHSSPGSAPRVGGGSSSRTGRTAEAVEGGAAAGGGALTTANPWLHAATQAPTWQEIARNSWYALWKKRRFSES